jgi:hypothetical protein
MSDQNGAGRAALQFPAADFPHAAGCREPGLLLREAAFGNFARRDVDDKCIESHDLIAVPVRQEFALRMPHGSVGIHIGLIELLAFTAQSGGDPGAPAVK